MPSPAPEERECHNAPAAEDQSLLPEHPPAYLTGAWSVEWIAVPTRVPELRRANAPRFRQIPVTRAESIMSEERQKTERREPQRCHQPPERKKARRSDERPYSLTDADWPVTAGPWRPGNRARHCGSSAVSRREGGRDSGRPSELAGADYRSRRPAACGTSTTSSRLASGDPAAAERQRHKRSRRSAIPRTKARSSPVRTA